MINLTPENNESFITYSFEELEALAAEMNFQINPASVGDELIYCPMWQFEVSEGRVKGTSDFAEFEVTADSDTELVRLANLTAIGKTISHYEDFGNALYIYLLFFLISKGIYYSACYISETGTFSISLDTKWLCFDGTTRMPSVLKNNRLFVFRSRVFDTWEKMLSEIDKLFFKPRKR